ncbi:hypothetical protein SAY86_021838 [Trapa natans]|uniref:PROP1-like PPR domain-containing protein n=1 Tax=Trapa natans TaxID=22666 RepID=A0AAN7MV83_TRANT|nr:hypothetical protein SAY86_021838 [Trapa natans]
MFMKLQFDAKCFHMLGSTKTLPCLGASFSPLETVEGQRGQRVLEIPGGDSRNLNGFSKWSRNKRRNGLAEEFGADKQKIGNYPDLKKRNDDDLGGRLVNGENAGVLLNGNRSAGKMTTKCSTKWLSYNGYVPAILQSLETIEDLDEAFRPWEERLSNKERSIILKEQSRWERALEIFEWFKRKGCYEINVIHYNIMFRTLGKMRKWKLLEGLWDEMNREKIEPINSTYGTLIDVYSKGGRREVAFVWLGKMAKQGIEPDEVTMGVIVQMFKKAGEFGKAEDFFRKWSEGECVTHRVNGSEEKACLSSYTYNTLIDTYGKSGRVQEAFNTFNQMLEEGTVPTTVTFNTMIHIYGNNNQLKEVNSLMKRMEQLRCSPDTRTYNILISLHAKNDNIGMARSYFERMKGAHLEPDLVSYRTILYAYSIRHMVSEAEEIVSEMDVKGLEIDEYTQSALTRMYIEAGLIEKSWEWFRRFHLLGSMSPECYSANIDAFGERGHICQAEKAFLCCQEKKRLSVLGFNVMIKAYGIAGCHDKACSSFDSMASEGVFPDKCSYSCLIQILANADFPHKAMSYLRKMQEAGLVEDCVPYCALISSFVKLGEVEMAEKLYREMIHYGVEPDIIVYGVLINAFAENGNIKEALFYVGEMEAVGLTGNAVIYNSLIKLYTKIGYLKEAEETYRRLSLLGASPDLYSSNCMIDLYSERLMVEQAEEIFQLLKQNMEANEFTFAMMLGMYKRLGRTEQALRIAKHMRESEIMSCLLSYNNVLGLYVMDGRIRDTIQTFGEMIKAEIRPDDCTYKSLGSILMKCGVPREAIGKLEVEAKREPKVVGIGAWMSALSAVIEVDNYT